MILGFGQNHQMQICLDFVAGNVVTRHVRLHVTGPISRIIKTHITQFNGAFIFVVVSNVFDPTFESMASLLTNSPIAAFPFKFTETVILVSPITVFEPETFSVSIFSYNKPVYRPP